MNSRRPCSRFPPVRQGTIGPEAQINGLHVDPDDPGVVGSCHFFEPIQIRSPSTATKGSTPVNHIWGHFVCLLISALAVLCPGRPEFDGFPYHMKSAIHLFTMDASFFI